MDFGGALVLRCVVEYLELLGLKQFDGRFVDEDGFPLKMFVEPVEGRHTQLLRVTMPAGGDNEPKIALFTVQFINAANLSEQAVDSVEREDSVVVRVEDK